MGCPLFRSLLQFFISLSVVWVASISPALGEVFHGSPTTYHEMLPLLKPGDTLKLQAGMYDDLGRPPGLPIFDLHGTSDAPIVITGPEKGPPTIFVGRSTHNTIRFDRASFIVVQNIEVDGRNLGGNGVMAQGVAHHITLEHLYIHGVGGNQGVVGISTTRGTTWNWIIRGCTIRDAGTGMYLGNSDGKQPFIQGLIEHNVFQDSIGYNVQIKHQVKHSVLPDLPSGPHATTIRQNTFTKSESSSSGLRGRPNLLIGHVPVGGAGQDDQYFIYGNVFYRNPSGEPLLQAEGNAAIYHNLFFNAHGAGIWIVPHNHRPRKIFVFQNTVIARGRGILVKGGEQGFSQVVAANVVFAGSGIKAEKAIGNFNAAFPAASAFLANPFAELGLWDLFPKKEFGLKKAVFERPWPEDFPESQIDFNGTRASASMVGAYGGIGKNPGVLPHLELDWRRLSDSSPAAPFQLRLE